MNNFIFNSKEINKIKTKSQKERDFRIKNLNFFNKNGFPNKRLEDWKFSDFREIIYKNFKKLNTKNKNSKVKKIDFIKDFDHNYIVTVNGELHSNNFKFEEKNKIELKIFQNKDFSEKDEINPLICLNHALSNRGYNLEIKDNYKFKKTFIIYNFFTEDLKDNILNSRNKIKVGKNSEFDDNPEVTAYLQVKDLTNNNNNEVFVFNGWTFY